MKQRPKASKGQTMNSHDSAPDDDTTLFFYMPNAKYGEFCQWYACTFTISRSQMSSLVEHAIDEDTANDPDSSITFSCAEQFMMYCKAGRFSDGNTQQKVLATDDAKEQKRLGRKTANFEAQSWDGVKSEVVVAGNIAKFGQNPSLKRKLLATGNRLLVEAASRDRVWGIGYSEKHAMPHQKHWGENRLGKALMEVRERLREEEETSDKYKY